MNKQHITNREGVRAERERERERERVRERDTKRSKNKNDKIPHKKEAVN